MNVTSAKALSWILNISVLFFAWALTWFGFVYYPQVVSDYRAGNFPKRTIVAPAVAFGNKLPIQTSAFRVTYEPKSDTYYAFVAGGDLEEYLANRDGAKLAIKTALSLENLCGVNVVFVSTKRVEIPDSFEQVSDC